MRRSLHRLLAAALAAALALALSACAPDDPQARVAKIRSEYKVTLNSWLPIRGEEAVPEAVEGEEAEGTEMAEAEGEAAGAAVGGTLAAEEEAVEAEIAEDAGEEGMEDPVEESPRVSAVLFDLIVQFDGDEPLPGVTLDITQADPFEQEKDHRRYWIDTANYHDGSFEQLTFELGGFDLEEGDAFSVEIRGHVPEEERAEYREFAEAGQ